MEQPGDHEARAVDDPGDLPAPVDCGADILAMLSDPSWVYRQYDHQLFLNTVEGPGGDAAVLRLAAPGLPASDKGLALTTDSNPTWCSIDPRVGTALTVCEGVLNVACAGARPVAVVNCLNFGNPEHPEVMWQLSECVDGMRDACLALGVPVIGGNVSLYNESFGVDINPTPVIGVLGLIDRLAAPPPGMTLVEGGSLVLLDASVGTPRGRPCHRPSLAGSRWAVEWRGHRNGTLPALDLAAHGRWSTSSAGWSLRTWQAGGLVGRTGAVRLRLGRSTTSPVVASGWRWPSSRFARESGVQVAGVADHHELFTESTVPGGGLHDPAERGDLPGGRGRGGVPGARHGRG